MTKDDVLALLEGEKFCVIATSGADGKPEAAFIGFSINQDLEITIGTSNVSRKYQNLSANPRVALVFNFDGHSTLQYEGTATELGNSPEDPYVQKHFAKLPAAEIFKNDPAQTWFVIKPNWVRLSRTNPWKVEEMEVGA